MPKTHAAGRRSTLGKNPKAVTGTVAEVHPSGAFDVYFSDSNTLSLCYPNRAGSYAPVRGQAVRCLLEFGTYGHVTAIEAATDTVAVGAAAPLPTRAAIGRRRHESA